MNSTAEACATATALIANTATRQTPSVLSLLLRIVEPFSGRRAWPSLTCTARAEARRAAAPLCPFTPRACSAPRRHDHLGGRADVQASRAPRLTRTAGDAPVRVWWRRFSE